MYTEVWSKKNPGSPFNQGEKNNKRILILILIEMVELCIWKVGNITKRLVRATCVRARMRSGPQKIHEMLDGSDESKQKEIS